MTLRVIWMTLTMIIDMKRYLLHIVLLLFAVMTMLSCEDKRPPRRVYTAEEQRRIDSAMEEGRRKQREYDSIHRVLEKERKEAHDAYIRQMARDIVNSGSKGRNYKEPTDRKQMYEDAMVGFDRYEDVDDDDDMRGFMEDND